MMRKSFGDINPTSPGTWYTLLDTVTPAYCTPAVILWLGVSRYEEAERRMPANRFLGFAETFGLPDAGYGVDWANDATSRQMRALQKEQRKFLREVFSKPDAIRLVMLLHSLGAELYY